MNHIKIPILAVADKQSVRLFGERSKVRVHIVELPAMQSVVGELLAERVADSAIPWAYRELHCPGNLLATVTPRVLLPSEIATADCERDLLQAVRRLVDACRADQQETVL